MLNMLYDKEFLLKLDKCKNKKIYARITALQFNESPIETIQGRVSGGSINIDGTSAVRRTCSITLVAQEYSFQDYVWGLKTKFKLEIGVENTVDPTMPKVIWFNQGIYLITSFNVAQNSTNFTISISGKDKMCLLNGEIGGSLESTVDFGTIEEESVDGIWTIRKIPIPEIIRNMVHVYGKEPFHNIVINDLDTYGLELMEYRYDVPMYFYRTPGDNLFANALMESDIKNYYLTKDLSGDPISLKDLDTEHLDLLVDPFTGSINPKPVYTKDGEEIIFAKVEYGQTAGYRVTDLTYAGDLIANVGEPVTSVLDKIKNMLVEFEYFYDTNGQFVFQKKRSFINTLWSPMSYDEDGNEIIAESLALASATAYTFSGNELITAISNSPNLTNMRNDYSIWGNRISASGATLPIHMRYAIDMKPNYYHPITVTEEEISSYNEKYGTSLNPQTPGESDIVTSEKYDWREVIYAMAMDYYKYNHLDDFELKVIQANPRHYPTGLTGYEAYYIDLEGFWRELYNPYLEKDIQDTSQKIENLTKEIDTLKRSSSTLENSIIALNEIITNPSTSQEEIDQASEQITSAKNSLAICRSALNLAESKLKSAEQQLEELTLQAENFFIHPEDGNKQHWNRKVFEAPETLNFWFDFLDSEGELSQFSVRNVGSRSKPVNDNNVKSIYFRETPSVIFTSDISKENQIPSYKYIQVDNIDFMFSISGQGKSAKDRLDELLYQHGYCIESATITAIPIYYLEPNVRVRLHDEKTHLDGDFVVSRISFSLDYSGMMTLTTTKAASNLY